MGSEMFTPYADYRLILCRMSEFITFLHLTQLSGFIITVFVYESTKRFVFLLTSQYKSNVRFNLAPQIV